MVVPLVLIAGAFACFTSVATAARPIISASQLQRSTPALPLGLWRRLNALQNTEAVGEDAAGASDQLTFAVPGELYTAYEFDQLVSHDPLVPAPFPNATFKQRYWFDATFYKPGGPVFLLDGGETSGADRIPFLKEGILRILSEATGGIGVVFEHRYYGESWPVRNLTTDSLRYLTTLQSLHDSAYFASHVVFPGLETHALTANKTAWIYYGGSYAGAKSAFARKLFPEVWWGAIASSAVTKAIQDYWEYMEPIRLSGPPTCIALLQNHTALIDSLLSLSQPLVTSTLKAYFGLGGISSDADFVNALQMPYGSWQGRNWDPQVGSVEFFEFCSAVTEGEEARVPAEVALGLGGGVLEGAARALLPGLPDPRKRFASFKGYAEYVKENIASMCPDEEEQDECFGTGMYEGDAIADSGWKSWGYQVCTEWGYFMTAPPEGHPSLVSALLTHEYTSQFCKIAFPRGKLNRVPNSPNVTEINQWGGFELSYPRLAFIDGSEDPWIYATPHSPNALNPNRTDTISQPFKLIPGGVHHWDENGRLDGDVPQVIQKVHEEEIGFVKAWMAEWRERGRWKPHEMK